MTFLCTILVRLLYIMLSFFEHFSEVRALSNVLFKYFSDIFPEIVLFLFVSLFVFSEKMKIVQETLRENEHLHSKCKRKRIHTSYSRLKGYLLLYRNH